MLKAKDNNIGKFDRKITIMQATAAASTSLGPKRSGYENIATDATPWARVRNKLGAEVIQNDQITHIQQTIFTVRYRTDITLQMVIVHNGMLYAIHSFAESGETRKKYLDITAEYVSAYP